MTEVPLIVAGCLAVTAAAVHGIAGEMLVMRKLVPETLPSTRFGNARMTRAMIHVSWHLVTVAFFAVGVALLLAGTAVEGDAARALGIIAACTCTGFAALAVAIGAADSRSPRQLYRHPGPALLTAVAALAWWGVL